MSIYEVRRTYPLLDEDEISTAEGCDHIGFFSTEELAKQCIEKMCAPDFELNSVRLALIPQASSFVIECIETDKYSTHMWKKVYRVGMFKTDDGINVFESDWCPRFMAADNNGEYAIQTTEKDRGRVVYSYSAISDKRALELGAIELGGDFKFRASE